MISTMKNKSVLEKISAVAIALLLWQLAADKIGFSVLLVSPLEVAKRLFELIFTLEFWQSVAFSFNRITFGFLCGIISGCVAAVLSYRYRLLEILLWPYVAAIKSTPVASFIILALVWLNGSNLSVFISFLMVFPIIYTNILTGLKDTDKKMLEMADIFRFSFIKKFVFIYLPQIRPYFLSSCGVCIGLGWKSGIAAEVIGIPTGSIGEKLYSAKLYLNTADLFAWTVTIVLISLVFEKVIIFLLKKLLYLTEDLL